MIESIIKVLSSLRSIPPLESTSNALNREYNLSSKSPIENIVRPISAYLTSTSSLSYKIWNIYVQLFSNGEKISSNCSQLKHYKFE